MRRSAVAAAVAAALAAAVGGGIALFPHALEPGRADRDGTTLNLVVGRAHDGVANDWYVGSSNAVVRVGRRAIDLRTRITGFVLVSRILPVFAHECYDVVARTRSTGEALVAVYDEDVTRYRDFGWIRPAATDETTRFRFATGGDRRVTLALVLRIGARVELEGMRLVRIGARRSCGIDRPGIDAGRIFTAGP